MMQRGSQNITFFTNDARMEQWGALDGYFERISDSPDEIFTHEFVVEYVRLWPSMTDEDAYWPGLKAGGGCLWFDIHMPYAERVVPGMRLPVRNLKALARRVS